MSDQITGRTELTLGDQYAAFYWGQPRHFRLAIVALALVFAIYVIDLALDPDANTVVMPAIIVFGVASWLGLIFIGFRRLSIDQKRVEYEIDSERVVTRDAAGTALILPWSQIRACHEHGPGFALLIRPAGSRWVVKRAFSLPDQVALRQLARSILGDSAVTGSST